MRGKGGEHDDQRPRRDRVDGGIMELDLTAFIEESCVVKNPIVTVSDLLFSLKGGAIIVAT